MSKRGANDLWKLNYCGVRVFSCGELKIRKSLGYAPQWRNRKPRIAPGLSPKKTVSDLQTEISVFVVDFSLFRNWNGNNESWTLNEPSKKVACNFESIMDSVGYVIGKS